MAAGALLYRSRLVRAVGANGIVEDKDLKSSGLAQALPFGDVLPCWPLDWQVITRQRSY